MILRTAVGVLSFLFLSVTVSAQAPVQEQSPLGRQVLRVFLDCRAHCDETYIRTELSFMDHVRDREVADVHILVTTEGAGSGGEQYTINFIGRGAFSGVEDTLRFTTTRDDTDDDIRRGLVRTLKLGLVRYLAQTPLAGSLDISYNPRLEIEDRLTGQTTDDRWDFWVFRVSMNARSDGEESNTGLDLSGSLSASRVTEAWKSSVNLSMSYDRSTYNLNEEDDDPYISISRSSSASALLIRTLGGHWGSGVRLSVSSSTYRNQRRRVTLSPAVEYNVFPYSETTRRQLTFRYSAGTDSMAYRSRTIYDKSEETLMSQAFAVNFDMRQPWGTMDFEVEASQYVPQFSKNRLSFESDIEVRLFRGFSLDLGAEASFIRDQIYLPAGKATPEEILLRQRQIATGYDYGFRMGFSYNFGSVFNNVVNSRLSGF